MNQNAQVILQYAILIGILAWVYLKVSGNSLADTIKKIKEFVGDMNGKR